MKFPVSIPTYENKTWSLSVFNTKEAFRDFLSPLFKEPGLYEFNHVTKIFNAEAVRFKLTGFYCASPIKTKDYIDYWDDQKVKCRNGIIVKDGHLTWYLTRDYYMWLNFLPIYDKEEKLFGFAKVRDAQYHMALYEILAELNEKHVVILKKRQIASSYFHMAKLINQWVFEEGAVLKIGASLKDYINEKGSWKFLNEYRNFLNSHTAWYRPAEPEKVGAWNQQIRVRVDNRDTYRGLKSVINSYSFEKDPTNGVGGPVTYFFHEEAGIAPKMEDTYGFIKPALKSGHLITGQFIAAGSVGDLDQCLPLKKYILYPEENGFFGVRTTLVDNVGTPSVSGLFIPEQWSMPPYIDEWGNSLVEKALEALDADFKRMKKQMDPAAFQLTISQQPRSIEEAFASRKESVFPLHLVAAQVKRIEDHVYPIEYLDLERDAEGKIIDKPSRKVPIMEFPLSKRTEDKSGVICIYERPHEKPTFGMYYASVDPVGEGKTTTSESLCSIYVYKTKVEVITDNGDGNVQHSIEHDKIVASWCGRFDDINKTHERLELMIEWYNAWTLVENNVALFIQYMISKRKQRYLVPKDMILFLKDIGANRNVFQEYGWKNVGTLFKGTILSYGVEFMLEELDNETTPEGDIVKTIYGIERIPDIMLLREAADYVDGLNVDRLVAYCSLVAFAKVQQSNRGMLTTTVKKTDLPSSNKLVKLNYSPFRHIGTGKGDNMKPQKRSAFKNIR